MGEHAGFVWKEGGGDVGGGESQSKKDKKRLHNGVSMKWSAAREGKSSFCLCGKCVSAVIYVAPPYSKRGIKFSEEEH